MVEESKWKPQNEEGDEQEEELDETAYKSVKDAVLFVIEVSPTMLERPPSQDSKKADIDNPTSAALKCAYALMQQRIIPNPNDMMGVLLYGTEKSRFQGEDTTHGGLAYPHCYLLTDLNIPAAEDVKTLRNLVEDEDESANLLVPSKDPVSMANVLFCANQIFTTRAPNFSSRRLFIVTDNDNPHAHEKALKSSAAVRAKDLYDLGVIIELFPIHTPHTGFDRAKFYDDIIYNALPSDPEAPAPISGATGPSLSSDGTSLLTSLLSSINSKAVARRALFSNLPFEIGPGFKISVKGFIILKRQEPKRSCYVDVGGEKAQIATGITLQVAEDTARLVEKVEIRKAYKFGGEQITFTPEEVENLRHFGDPGIRIIGFKPLSMLPIWANLRPSTFIYPSEEDYVGSTRVFSALHQKLLQDGKMGVAWFVARKNATPQIAAVIPGAERLDHHNAQTTPPGLWIIPLPFADDIRQNPQTTLIRAPETLIDRMGDVVRTLQLPKAQYDPSRYPNPALQWHYRILQAMALDEDLPTAPEDKTVPRYKQIDKRAGELTIEWGKELHMQHELHRKNTANQDIPLKRGAPQGDELVMRAKMAKMEEVVVDEREVRTAYDTKTIGKLTIPTLKSFLQAKGLRLTGKKDQLIERVEKYFDMQ